MYLIVNLVTSTQRKYLRYIINEGNVCYYSMKEIRSLKNWLKKISAQDFLFCGTDPSLQISG